MKARSATDILRAFARERWLRRAVRSVALDPDRSGIPRMSESAYVDSCALTRGVPPDLLDVLGVRETMALEATWTRVAIDLPDRVLDLPTEQVARPMTMAQAAAVLGYDLPQPVLKAMRLAAIAVVGENMMRRREGREEVAA